MCDKKVEWALTGEKREEDRRGGEREMGTKYKDTNIRRCHEETHCFVY